MWRKTVVKKKRRTGDVLPRSTFAFVRIRRMREYISEQFPREYLASSPCSISGAPWKARGAIERARALRKEEKSFYKFHSLPFAFLLCPTALNVSVRAPKYSSPLDEREYSRQSSLFARSGAVSLFVIASNFSGRYPVGDKGANLNKTNQYSNPPLSLADSPSVSFSAFLLASFYFLLYLFLFISISRRTFDFDHFHLLGLFLVCSDLSFIDTISEASHLFASLCRNDLFFSRPFQSLYSLDFNSLNNWFHT